MNHIKFPVAQDKSLGVTRRDHVVVLSDVTEVLDIQWSLKDSRDTFYSLISEYARQKQIQGLPDTRQWSKIDVKVSHKATPRMTQHSFDAVYNQQSHCVIYLDDHKINRFVEAAFGVFKYYLYPHITAHESSELDNNFTLYLKWQ